MGLGLGERGRLWGCRGSASHWVGDSRPDSYALYSVIGCTHTDLEKYTIPPSMSTYIDQAGDLRLMCMQLAIVLSSFYLF